MKEFFFFFFARWCQLLYSFLYCIQQVVDDLAIQARDDGFQVNERKCKELSFGRNEPEFDPIWLPSESACYWSGLIRVSWLVS